MADNQLADFVSAQNIGYESGAKQAQPNGLGMFIRTMLAEQQRNKAIVEEYGQRKELAQTEATAKTNAEVSSIQSIIGQGNGTQGGFQPTKFQIGGVTLENPQANLANRKAEQLQDVEMKSYITPEKQKQDLQKAKLAAQSLNYMKDKAKNLPTGGKAMASNVGNFLTRGALNPQLALYEKQMPAMATTIYREITGDTRLSDQDAESRALPLLWDARKGEANAIKEGVFEDLDKLYQARIRLIEKGSYKPNPKDPSEFITPMEDVMAEAKIGSSNQSIKQYVRTGTDTTTGKKVGMLEDGTIEEIQ